MKIVKAFIVAIVIVAGAVAVVWKFWPQVFPKSIVPEPQITILPTAPAVSAVTSTLIFVPYWADFEDVDVDTYDTVVYFGITPGSSGIQEEEPGFAHLEEFSSTVPAGKKTILALRMTDQEQAASIVQNKERWDTIVTETLDIAEKYKFDGVVLDLELSPLTFKDLTGQVTDFVTFFYSHNKGRNLTFAITIYGDTIYRARPYDLAALSGASDEMWVMAYDFHKSKGLPGPNFPLEGQEKYGYDFKTMVEDMVKRVDPNKLRILFGMYGYDWLVNEDKKPFSAATSLTLAEIQKKFLGSCTFKNCVVQRDPAAGEQEVNYVDEDAFPEANIAALHIIWFEDEESARLKMEYATKRGIDKVGYWAYGYF